MKKVAIDQIEHTANSVGIEPKKVDSLVTDLKKAIEEEAALNEGKEREKKQFLILANTDGLSADVCDALAEIPMIIIQYPEDADHNEAIGAIETAARAYNLDLKENKKKNSKREPVKSIFEAAANVQAKVFKSEKVSIKTKEPVIVLKTDNKIKDLPQDTQTDPQADD